MDELNETRLVEGAQCGDRASQEALVRLYERRVYSLILRLVENKEDARDVLQDTMIKALASIKTYDGRRPYASWLFRIATNKSLDLLRRRKLEFRIFEYEAPLEDMEDLLEGEDAGGGTGGQAAAGTDGDLATAQAGGKTIDSALVARCIDRLAPRYRTVLHLRYREDLAYKEIAEVLAIPIGTVKVLLHRGHAELKRQVLGELAE